MPPSWLPSIPANARSSAVVLTRPCTFLFSLLLGLAALVASAFFSLTHLSPPQCRCCAATDDEPRTRPRPASPTEPRPPALREPQPQTRSTFEHFLTAFRPSSRPPLAVRRVSARVLGGGFAPHELDELKEAEEEEEADEEEEEDVVREKSRSTSPGAVAPALTPDAGSVVDTDGGSEVSTVEDDRAHLGQPVVSKAGKPKGLAIFTGLHLRRTPSASKKASSTSPVSASPEELSGSSSPTSSIHSASSSSLSSACRKACPVKALRQRASTTAGASRPNLPSTLAPIPRRQFSEPGLSSPETDYFSQTLLSPSSASFATTDTTTASSLLSDTSASTSATSLSSEPTPSAPQLNRKRSVSSLFLRTPFRSISPLARSPLTSPEPSPPPSPTLAPPQWSQSLAAKAKSKRTRGRSPGPSPAVEPPRAPQLRKRVSSGPGADCTGASGLALSDVVA